MSRDPYASFAGKIGRMIGHESSSGHNQQDDRFNAIDHPPFALCSIWPARLAPVQDPAHRRRSCANIYDLWTRRISSSSKRDLILKCLPFFAIVR
jgi:hypothetical protein